MSPSSHPQSTGQTIVSLMTVRLVNWPLRQEPLKAAIIGLLAVALSLAAGRLSQSYAMGCLVLVVLILASWRIWLPVQFEFSHKGIIQSVLGRRRRIPWTQVRRYEARRAGVLLLSDSVATPLSPLRGIFIRWNGHRDELMEILEAYLNPNSSSLDSTRTYPS